MDPHINEQEEKTSSFNYDGASDDHGHGGEEEEQKILENDEQFGETCEDNDHDDDDNEEESSCDNYDEDNEEETYDYDDSDYSSRNYDGEFYDASHDHGDGGEGEELITSEKDEKFGEACEDNDGDDDDNEENYDYSDDYYNEESSDYSNDYDDGYSEDWCEKLKENYQVYPFSHIGKSHLEAGNKIILPLSALEILLHNGVEFPMLFKIENPNNGRTSHCGVLEFTGEEGKAFMPDWMIKNMALEEQGLVNLESVTLERATFLKLQPHSMEFLHIRNPRDVLEDALCGGYSCLTVGDTIVIMHEGKEFYVDVVDAKPSNAVCVIDTDVEVDFAPPLDYEEPEKQATSEEEPPKAFVPFSGRARKLNGAGVSESQGTVGEAAVDVGRSGVQVSERKNELVFGGVSSSTSTTSTKISKEEQSFKPFTGRKYRLMDS